jgi:hypothetical protein
MPPAPKIASANPTAHWFARKVSASTPKTSDAAALASAPARTETGME